MSIDTRIIPGNDPPTQEHSDSSIRCQKCNVIYSQNISRISWCQSMSFICKYCFKQYICCNSCGQSYDSDAEFIEDGGLTCDCGGDYIITPTPKLNVVPKNRLKHVDKVWLDLQGRRVIDSKPEGPLCILAWSTISNYSMSKEAKHLSFWRLVFNNPTLKPGDKWAHTESVPASRVVYYTLNSAES